MFSHTVPKKLLEQFAYDDPVTRSPRLWQYRKGRKPWPKASPKTATAWEGHFADPEDRGKETKLELRLKQEFEDPVNQFIETIGTPSFCWQPKYVYLLTGYIRMLFARSRSRQGASAEHVKAKRVIFEALLKDDKKLVELAHHHAQEMIELGYWITRPVRKSDVVVGIEKVIAEHSKPDEPQRDYIRALEGMFSWPDETMMNGTWGFLKTGADHPFVIGDAPVVTFERSEQNILYWGQGFARPNVEVFLPISPTTCLHVLPRVQRTRQPRQPSAIEVNMGQAAFATDYCFGNVNHVEIDAALQPQFGKMRMSITGFNTHHIDYSQVLFDILMGRRPKAA